MKIYENLRVLLGHRDLLRVLEEIRVARKTGSLTVHWGQGSVTELEWNERTQTPAAVQAEWGMWPFSERKLSPEKNLPAKCGLTICKSSDTY